MNFSWELSQEDVERFKSEFEAVAKDSSAESLARMGHVAVENLRSLDESLGHHYLASQWDATDPVDDGESVYVDVFSHAEDETFYNAGWDASGNRVQRDPRFPVPGRMLLAILEGGAQAHYIFPRSANKLIVPVPGIAERTTKFQKQYGFAYNHTPDGRDVAHAEDVVHPGVVANDNIANTAELIEIGLDTFGEGLAEDIAVRLR